MDPEKHRYSLALPRDDSASGFSALRSSTRSPSFRRLSLRKSRSSSCSTADSASIRSTEFHISPQSSCVTRDIPRNECAFHRFMIWVAVKRNECERMTPSERLECPLLRCRKRFMNHEQMLRHLYTCDELDSGEYWCYDCERPERFTDAQCKRCLGHPKKRRKILSMAKNFFTSLGHKSRKEGLLRSLPEDDALVPPPSYDSLDLHLTNELCSAGEIHEIDSTEVPPVSIAAPAPAPATMHNTPPLSEPEPPLFLSSTIQQPPPPCIFPAELDTRISLANPHESAIESWINDPIAYVPSEDSGRRHSTEEQRMKTRSKTLAPSSSLRSNASNSSTNTTNTTNSTDSTNTVSTGISPSIWSEPWTIASGFGTELESPISNFLCPSKFHDENVNMGSCDNAFDGDVFMRDFIPELPADLPLLAPLPDSSDNLAVPQDIISLGAPTGEGDDPAITTYSNADLLPDVTNAIPNSSAEASPSSDPRSPLPSSVEPSALVSTILETLQAHVCSSEAKLRPMSDNGLAAQFLAVDSRIVASYGHATLKAKLQGRPPDSTLHLLCYVHVVYAYFLVLHQEEAGTHSQGLFPYALAYATGLALPSQPEYLEIAHAIWEPGDLGEAVSTKPDTLQLGSRDPFSTTLSAARKGKGPCDGVPVKDDALLTVAQYLLDEFEYSILACNPCSSDEVLSSELFMSHATAGSLAPPARTNTPPAFWNVTGNTVNNAIQRFGSHPGLTSALQSASQRISKGYPSARKAELELLQAAYGCIPLTTIINGYAPFIRDQCEALYSIQPTDLAWRPTYYSQVIDLIESMVSSLVPTQYTLKSPDTSDIDEFLALPTPFMDSSAGVSPEYAATWDSLSTNTPAAFSNNVSKADASSGQPSPHGDHREPDLSTPQSGSGDGEPQPATQKVEADACCEICGYRPKGHPQWFKGSMAKHKKLQHSAKPPKIYKCSYPGCTSQYKNRQDNLRQHKLDKGHFIDGEEEMMHKRPSKRKKL